MKTAKAKTLAPRADHSEEMDMLRWVMHRAANLYVAMETKVLETGKLPSVAPLNVVLKSQARLTAFKKEIAEWDAAEAEASAARTQHNQPQAVEANHQAAQPEVPEETDRAEDSIQVQLTENEASGANVVAEPIEAPVVVEPEKTPQQRAQERFFLLNKPLKSKSVKHTTAP